MMGRERYVFDTNVLVSALLFEQSKPGQAFYLALECGDILVSSATLAELAEVLARPKFDRYLRVDERNRFLAALIRAAELVEVAETIQACRDPKDDRILELAVNGAATCIISGDKDLLDLKSFRAIHIITPDELLMKLRQH